MLLHWLLAALIISNFLLGLTMVDIAGITPTKLKYFSWHKWTGVTIFALATLRLLWRLWHPAPALPATVPHWQRTVATVTHYLLYALMFAVPLSGYFYSLASGVPVVYLQLIPLPQLIEPNPVLKPLLKELHYLLNIALATLVIGHLGAALKHHFFDRDDVLTRMLPRLNK
jgi:cytochrome b561